MGWAALCCHPAYKSLTTRTAAPAILPLPRPLQRVAVFSFVSKEPKTVYRVGIVLVLRLSLAACGGAPQPTADGARAAGFHRARSSHQKQHHERFISVTLSFTCA